MVNFSVPQQRACNHIQKLKYYYPQTLKFNIRPKRKCRENILDFSRIFEMIVLKRLKNIRENVSGLENKMQKSQYTSNKFQKKRTEKNGEEEIIKKIIALV